MTLEHVECIRTYYVVFDKKRHNLWRWWHYFTGHKFYHCFVLTEIDEGLCLKIEPIAGGVDVQTILMPIDQCIAAYAEGGVTAIVSYTVNSTNLNSYVKRGFISCVSLVKALLWVRKSCLTFTPFQLYKLLLRRGANAIKPYTPYIK